jgi:hypothetical protein
MVREHYYRTLQTSAYANIVIVNIVNREIGFFNSEWLAGAESSLRGSTIPMQNDLVLLAIGQAHALQYCQGDVQELLWGKPCKGELICFSFCL